MTTSRTRGPRAAGRGAAVGRAGGVAALALLALAALPVVAQEPQRPATATEEAAPAAPPATQEAAGPSSAEPATTGTTGPRPPAAGTGATAPAPSPAAAAATAALEEGEKPAAAGEAAPEATTAAVGEETAPAPAAPTKTILSEEEVAARIADAYGVEVLKVARDDLVGGPAYAVKVMRPGGESNAAFRVSTLMVDGVTGELIPQFRHRNAGYQRSGAFRAEPGADAAGEELRLRTFRAGPEAIQ